MKQIKTGLIIIEVKISYFYLSFISAKERPSLDSILRKGFIQKVGAYLESGVPKIASNSVLSSPVKKKTSFPPSKPIEVKRSKLKSSKLNWKSLPSESSPASNHVYQEKNEHKSQKIDSTKDDITVRPKNDTLFNYETMTPNNNSLKHFPSFDNLQLLQNQDYSLSNYFRFPQSPITDCQANKLAAKEFKQRNMEDVFNRSFVGSKDFSSNVNSSDSKILKSEFIALEEKNEVEECRIIGKTETDHLRELEV